MLKKINMKKVAIAVLLIVVIMQFFTINKTNVESDPILDLIAVTQPNDQIVSILKTSCYNCHSNTTEYPWYSNVAPVSWWIKEHVDNGKKHLNFSIWGEYSVKKQDHKLEELIEMVEEDEMPLPSYTWSHRDAILSAEQKEALVTWTEELRATYDIEE